MKNHDQALDSIRISYAEQWLATGPDFTDFPVDVELIWSRTAPIAITLTFPGQEALWEISRELLRAGLNTTASSPVGEGDVRIAPAALHPDELTTIDLVCYLTGEVTRLYASTEDLQKFLDDIDQALPPGQENLTPALEHALDRILKGEDR